MASLTIRNIDDGLKGKLRVLAARNGRSMEEEARFVLRSAVEAAESKPELTEAEIERRVERALSYGRHDPEPFDLKAFSDALSDDSE